MVFYTSFRFMKNSKINYMGNLKIQEIKAQQPMKLLKHGQQFLKNNEGQFEISAYQGELTPTGVAECAKKLMLAFPELSNDFHTVLAERVKELGFSDQRLMDSVNHVIDTCEYPRPTIAKFISYDKKIKLLTYDQMLKMNDELAGRAFEFYKSVRIEGYDKPLYAHIKDIQQFKLEPFRNLE